MEQGPSEKTIIEQCIRQRLPLPEKIANAPSIHLGLEVYYVAFIDLTSCRNVGMGEGPIPWTATRLMSEELGLVGEQREDLFFYIGKMDTAYLDYRAKKREVKTATKE